MATLTNEQIEQKKQQLKQLAEEMKALKDELVEAGALPLDEDDLDKAAGGFFTLPTPPDLPPIKPVFPTGSEPTGSEPVEILPPDM